MKQLPGIHLRGLTALPLVSLSLTLTMAAPAMADASATEGSERAEALLDASEQPEVLRAEAERRVRTYRAVLLAEHLDLDEERVLQMNAIMSRYDEDRRRIQSEMRADMSILQRAARGEGADEDEVTAAVERVLRARARMESLRQEEARELLGNLTPERQASLMIFFQEFPRRVERFMRRHHREEGAGGGPRERRRSP